MSLALSSSAHPNGRCTDRTLVARFVEGFGLELLGDDDIVQAREISAELIGEKLASAATLIECQRAARSVVFGYRENGALTGMMALLPLNEIGRQVLEDAVFDAEAPPLNMIARPDEAPACYYAWGIAAISKDASRAMIKASAALHGTLFWNIPAYTRAATADGLRLMSSFGYHPYSDHDPSLIKAMAPGRPRWAQT